MEAHPFDHLLLGAQSWKQNRRVIFARFPRESQDPGVRVVPLGVPRDLSDETGTAAVKAWNGMSQVIPMENCHQTCRFL